ncbi:MAG: type II glyceraldehyde-3-phosphate dehydrogenase [Candidatus Aenigmarchaeota archaeon]|nr:type II glyceraldehyde-3-phosphate dehydrogenase [Candidatus Aenigmarchaeota archaeon]
MSKVRVGINGFGTIGKRVAHAVSLQTDMKLVGVANRSVNINVRNMLGKKGPLYKTDLYCSEPANMKTMESTHFKVKGSLEDLLRKVDVIIDGTPAGIEAKNKPLYQKHRVKQIYQGGADKNVADASFTAIANYEKCVGKDSLRVVSCNTTSLVRTIHAVNETVGLKDIFAVLVRRAADPHEDADEGPIISVVPVTKVPSHHGPDVQTVLPKINITTMACAIPTTLNHTHFITATMDKECSREDIIDAFRNACRVLLFRAGEGYETSSQIAEYFRDTGRPRSDMFEACVWEETVNTVKNKLYWCHVVHSEAITIPENIDAIRAVMNTDKKLSSIRKTNKSLNIEK